MEDQPGALEHCARMNNQRMTMRDITELMERVTAMLFAFRRWKGGVIFATRERTPGRRCVSMSTQSLLKLSSA